MGLTTLLRSILGFPHPEDISPRGTPVCILDVLDAGPCTNETLFAYCSRRSIYTDPLVFAPSSAPRSP